MMEEFATVLNLEDKIDLRLGSQDKEQERDCLEMSGEGYPTENEYREDCTSKEKQKKYQKEDYNNQKEQYEHQQQEIKNLERENKDHSVATSEDFNSVLTRTGGFGILQKVLFCIQCLACFFYSFILMGPIFLSLTPPDHWCAPHPQTKHFFSQKFLNDSQNFPEEFYNAYTSSHSEKEQASLLKNASRSVFRGTNAKGEEEIRDEIREELVQKYIKFLTVPFKSDGRDADECLQYDVDWHTLLASEDLLLPNKSWPTASCQHGWDYDYSIYYPSITSEMSWVCADAFRAPTSQAVVFLGSIFGGPFFGFLADSRGRRTTIVVSNTLVGAAGVVAALSTGFITYCVSMFVLGANAYSQLNILYILAMEFATAERRSFVAMIPFTVFLTLGFTIIPWLAYGIANWRILALVLYGPLLLSPLLWKVLPESTRWLISKNRRNEALQSLLEVARFNRVQLDSQSTKFLADFVSRQASCTDASTLDVLKTPRLRKHFIVLCVIIISVRILFDSHVRIIKVAKFNFFVTFSVSSCLEVFSGLAAYALAEKVSRRFSCAMTLFFSAALEACTALVSTESFIVQTSLLLLGRVVISTAMDLCIILPVEVLPTVIRSQAVGVIYTLGFTVSFVSPYVAFLADWNKPLALLILAAVGVGGGLSVFLLPETKGQNLPDTLDEGEHFGKK